jgi:hypothetical protein
MKSSAMTRLVKGWENFRESLLKILDLDQNVISNGEL